MADRRVEIMAVARPNEIKYKNLTVFTAADFFAFYYSSVSSPLTFLIYFISIFLLFRLAFLLSVTLLD
jgi:hypothetical protein